MEKKLNWGLCGSLILCITVAWLLSACQPGIEPELSTLTPGATTAIPAPDEPTTTSTSMAVENTPTELPQVTETPDVAPGKATPGVPPAAGDDQAMWLVTDSAILRTTDAGSNWEDVTPPGIQEVVSGGVEGIPPAFAVAFSDGESALAAYSMRNRAILYRTNDGGQTWQETVLDLQEEAQGVTSIDMLDERAWMLVTRGVGAGNDWVDLYFSEDGGASWRFLAGSESESNPSGGISSGGLKTGLSFNSPNSGWLTGSAPIEMVYLFRTVDGGLSWQPYNLPLPEGALFSGSSYPPIFFDEQNGLLPVSVGTSSDLPGLLFYATSDAGENWLPTVMLEGYLSAWDWVDPQLGFAAGTDEQMQSKLFVTRDGGASWEAFLLEMPMVRSLDFISEQEGWAVCGWAVEPMEGCTGDVYHTQDGGRSWERVHP